MTQDRTYWRDQTDARLIDEAKHCPSAELCIALGERLDDTHEADRWCEELKERCDSQQAAIIVMRAEIKALEDQVDDMLGATDND
tara:strand:+ start:1063 stop:1317 length:255 start_codon:yes stop_codon:yes gene_type:complete